MSIGTEKPVKFLVVDSSAFIRSAPLKDLTNTVYTVDEVVSEIRDETTRASLQIVPYDFKFKQPSSDSTAFVCNFARKTGDYSNLSAVDLQLLALTYQLCKENYDSEQFKHLKTEPTTNHQPLVDISKLKLDKPVNIAGFYLPPKKQTEKKGSSEIESVTADMNQKLNLSAEEDLSTKQEDEAGDENNNIEEENGEDEDALEDEDDSWITPANIEAAKKQNLIETEQQEIKDMQLPVGCMTSDFAMQNVLIQIGIPVLSVDGLLIRKARSYVLRCITCLKITTNMLKQFCPTCGNKTLERTVVMVDAEGNRVYRGRRKAPSTKGLRFSLPTPRGGKHSNYPILSEDQPRPQNYPSRKAMERNDPLDPDYVNKQSPFATNDIYSRAGRLGIKNKSSDRFNKRI